MERKAQHRKSKVKQNEARRGKASRAGQLPWVPNLLAKPLQQNFAKVVLKNDTSEIPTSHSEAKFAHMSSISQTLAANA